MKKYFLIAAVSFFALSSQAQSNSTKAVKPAKKQVAEAIKPKDWDPTTDIFDPDKPLPQNYSGTSAKEIIIWIEKKNPKKGEFEKQAEFNERIARENSVFDGKLYAFKIYSGKYIGADIRYESYDADKEAFISNPGFMFISKGTVNFKLQGGGTELGSYIGTNGYGQSIKVEKSYGEYFGIHVDANELKSTNLFKNKTDSSLGFVHELNMPIEEARKFDLKKINALLIGSINPTDIKEDSGCSKPTIDKPYDGCTTWKYVRLNLKEIIIYNSDSGKILHQTSSNDQFKSKIKLWEPKN